MSVVHRGASFRLRLSASAATLGAGGDLLHDG
jgi:hypothetical protein